MMENDISTAAKVMAKAGARKGGLARAYKQSESRRSAIARKAARARWGKKEKS